MTSTISIALHISSPPVFSALLQEKPTTVDDAEMQALEELPPPEVTSNIRQRSPSPDPSLINEQTISLRPRVRNDLADDPVFGLPPPDLAPRFVFRPYMPSVEELTSVLTSDGTFDPSQPIQVLPYAPSSTAPRIYFAHSALTFVPPFSYDFLARDPNAKGVPRNYRAWARTGRTKLDVDGLERAEAKSDFLAMGLPFPQDSESEDGGKVGEHEKKKRKKKKKMEKAQMVPIERPRRTARKIVEAELPVLLPPPKKRVIDKKPKEVQPEPTPPVQPPDAMSETGAASKSTETSESSGRRSSSTLLDTDVAETGKRKRVNSDKGRSEIPPPKKQRISKRLYARQNDTPERIASPELVPEEEWLERSHSPLSDLTPSPEPPSILERKSNTSLSERRRSSSPGTSHLRPRRAVVASSHSAPAGSSRPTQLPASRPGHRLNRDVSSAQPQSAAIRTFPTSLPILPGYSGFYRRYPFITQFEKDDPVGKHVHQGDSQLKRSLGNWNAPRDHRDLYTPRYTKGSGNKKIALCPLCYEDLERGGEGRQEWNHTKTSQHNYHMQYYHGISATRCSPFSPPIAQRTVSVPRPQTNEKSEILQGKCHCCKQWIALEGCKIGELKVKELFWWKHAAGCHKDSKLNGEADVFIEDDHFRRLKEYEAANPSHD